MALKVVIALIQNSLDRDMYFIAKRPLDTHQGGLWEFPGGKIESGESAEQALFRELQEELDIEVTDSTALFEFAYDYPDKSIFFTVYQVNEYNGQAKGNEGQDVLWIKKSQLTDYTFPDANKKIIQKLLAA